MAGADMIVGVDINPKRKALAEKFGMTHFVNPTEVQGDLVPYLVDLTKGGAGLGSDDFKRTLCELCERAGADWVKTSSGYGFVKQADGSYNYTGATEHDLALMRASVSARVQVKAAGGVRDLDGLIRVRDLGASRCGATATAPMLDEYRRREAAEKAGTQTESKAAAIGSGGY
jgi:deoxyribose-phosphate aldolase